VELSSLSPGPRGRGQRTCPLFGDCQKAMFGPKKLKTNETKHQNNTYVKSIISKPQGMLVRQNPNPSKTMGLPL